MQRLFSFALIGLLALALVWVGFFWEPAAPSRVDERPRGGAFEFQSLAGPVSLEQLRGKVVVLYFGYTWCPDICPTSLGMLSAALSELTEQELAGLRSLFISVDPERDTLEKLATYADYFHPNLIGVTGAREQIDAAVARYGAAYRIVKEAKMGDRYVVDHSADLYLIDRRGGLVRSIPHGTPPEQILAALRSELKRP